MHAKKCLTRFLFASRHLLYDGDHRAGHRLCDWRPTVACLRGRLEHGSRYVSVDIRYVHPYSFRPFQTICYYTKLYIGLHATRCGVVISFVRFHHAFAGILFSGCHANGRVAGIMLLFVGWLVCLVRAGATKYTPRGLLYSFARTLTTKSFARFCALCQHIQVHSVRVRVLEFCFHILFSTTHSTQTSHLTCLHHHHYTGCVCALAVCSRAGMGG